MGWILKTQKRMWGSEKIAIFVQFVQQRVKKGGNCHMKLLDRSIRNIDAQFAKIDQLTLGRFDDLNRMSRYVDKMDSVVDICYDIISQCDFARLEGDKKTYNAMDGFLFRVYNGEYWEQVYSNDIIMRLTRFLRNHGVSSSLISKVEKKLLRNAVNLMRNKVLEPRNTLMCFKNGVVDFSESQVKLKKFSPKYEVVKQYDFNFDMKADATLWKNFLGEPYRLANVNMDGVLPELQKRRLLQMFLGSMLIDRSKVKFEHFMILQGSGSNGKGVIFQVIQGIFGSEEVNTLSLANLNKSGDEGLRAAYALKGKRILYCPEEVTIKSAKNLSFLKSIVSGEPIQMRGVGQDIQDIIAPPVIMFNTNHKFKMEDFFNEEDATDISMTRRVRIVNFEHTIPLEKRDTLLAQRLLTEKAGIFAWIVKGWVELRKNGYRMPQATEGDIDVLLRKCRNDIVVGDRTVSGSVDIYFKRKRTVSTEEEDTLKLELLFAPLYENYRAFCLNEGVEPVSSSKFGHDLTTLGYDKRRTREGPKFVTLYCHDEKIANDYIVHVPSLVENADADVISGENWGDDDELVYIE